MSALFMLTIESVLIENQFDNSASVESHKSFDRLSSTKHQRNNEMKIDRLAQF
jgi:hypothetical protein